MKLIIFILISLLVGVIRSELSRQELIQQINSLNQNVTKYDLSLNMSIQLGKQMNNLISRTKMITKTMRKKQQQFSLKKNPILKEQIAAHLRDLQYIQTQYKKTTTNYISCIEKLSRTYPGLIQWKSKSQELIKRMAK